MCPHAATHVSAYYLYGEKLKLEAHYLSDAYQVFCLLALLVQKYEY